MQAHQRGVLEGTFGLAWAQQTGTGVEHANLTAARELYTAALLASPSDAEKVGVWLALRVLTVHEWLHCLMLTVHEWLHRLMLTSSSSSAVVWVSAADGPMLLAAIAALVVAVRRRATLRRNHLESASAPPHVDTPAVADVPTSPPHSVEGHREDPLRWTHE
jgi:hypothetical protein